MEFIDLDKFKEKTKVNLDGKEYHVSGVSVGDFVNSTYDEEIKKTDDPRERVKVAVRELVKQTNIPEEVLYKQPFSVLNALILISQDVDPTKDRDDPKKKE